MIVVYLHLNGKIGKRCRAGETGQVRPELSFCEAHQTREA